MHQSHLWCQLFLELFRPKMKTNVPSATSSQLYPRSLQRDFSDYGFALCGLRHLYWRQRQ